METFKWLLKNNKILVQFKDDLFDNNVPRGESVINIGDRLIYTKYIENLERFQILLLLNDLGHPFPLIVGYDEMPSGGVMVYSISPQFHTEFSNQVEAFQLMNANPKYFFAILFEFFRAIAKMQDAYAGSLDPKTKVVVWLEDNTLLEPRSITFKKMRQTVFKGLNIGFTRLQHTSLIMYGNRTNTERQKYDPISNVLSAWQVLESLYEQTAKLKLDNLAKSIVSVTFDLFNLDPLNSGHTHEKKPIPRNWLKWFINVPRHLDWVLPNKWYELNFFGMHKSRVAYNNTMSTTDILQQLHENFSYFPKQKVLLFKNKLTSLQTPSLFIYFYRAIVLGLRTYGPPPSSVWDQIFLGSILEGGLSTYYTDKIFDMLSQIAVELTHPIYANFLRLYLITRGRNNTPAMPKPRTVERQF